MNSLNGNIMRKIRFNGVYKDLLEEFVQFKRVDTN